MDSKDLVKKAKELSDYEQYEEALDILEDMYQNNPDEIIRSALTKTLFAYGGYLTDIFIDQNEKAAECFKRIIELDPKNYRAYYNLGISYSNLDKNEDALKACNEALRLKPDYKHCLYNIGLIYEQKQDFATALKYHEKALEIDPNFTYSIQAVRDVRQRIDMERGKVHEPNDKQTRISQLKSLIKMSKRLNIDYIQELLGIDRTKLFELLTHWGEKFKCEIDGLYLNVNEEYIDDLLADLDNMVF